MVRDKEATKAKLLEAALDEFAEYGIAGARVDRIAAKAGCNKAMIYAYFVSKEGLFEELLRIQIDRMIKSVPITPEDLPGYAGRLFDSYVDQPQVLRLAAYHRLENGFDNVPAPEAEAYQHKVAAIAQAQMEGKVSAAFNASDLLDLVVHTSILAFSTPNATRDLVERSVRRLIAE
ncbi:TetR family transcriptional regulator [Lentzea sp. BCCO 10_0856]|uniref:TetR family transcriptional regulator n=1 Tax=Lentzea miocenica TaxID=3095431 RepID=A0ABU4SZ17_9PSEU|nr:TetR family transcriptional regulator [Lentzea sp. BCCO 10_0856]MDX8031154.1 TetR family transcriptional regulator [Lentzea sp. BCCO 10_0856]